MPKQITDTDVSMKRGHILEKDIQRAICDWLFAEGYFFWRSNNTPIFDVRKKIYRAMPKYTPKGLPDIMIIVGGRFIGLEVKTPNYWKYTDDQAMMKSNIIANGGEYHLVTSLDEAQAVMAIHRI